MSLCSGAVADRFSRAKNTSTGVTRTSVQQSDDCFTVIVIYISIEIHDTIIYCFVWPYLSAHVFVFYVDKWEMVDRANVDITILTKPNYPRL